MTAADKVLTTVETQDQAEDMLLSQVPEQLWIKHPSNVGLVKPAGQVLIKLKRAKRESSETQTKTP